MDAVASLRYSIRSLARTPGVAAALLVSIALGLGSNAVLYGFVRGLIATTLANAGTIGAGETRVELGATAEIVDALDRVGMLLRIAAGSVLLVACTNVAVFLLARASARSRETSVRVAIGASRARLAALVLSDALVIVIAGGAAGLLLASWTSSVLPALFFSEDAQHLSYTPDMWALGVSALAGALIIIATGLLPLIEMRDDRPAVVLQRESAGPSLTMRRLRAGLVVLEMSCCSALMISTGILWQSFRAALETPAGQQLHGAFLATLQVRPESISRHEILQRGLAYYTEAEKAVRSVAGVTSTAWVATIPGGAPVLQSFDVELPATTARAVEMRPVILDESVVDRLSLPPVAGRLFGGQDTAESCRVGVLDHTAAQQYFDGHAVGRAIEDRRGHRIEIIGVAAIRPDIDSAVVQTPAVFLSPNQAGDSHESTYHAVGRDTARIAIETNVVSPEFFSLMESRPEAGLIFPVDLSSRACGVAVVNHEAAERYFGGAAVGTSIIDASGRRSQVVGVVPAPRLLALQRRIEPMIYLPMTQTFLPRMALLIRTANADRGTLTTVRRRLETIKGAFRPPSVVGLEQHLNRTALAPLRIATVLIGGSAGIAITLGILGLAGVMAESAHQRRREFALRIALGSQAWRVRRDVIVDGVKLAGAGIVVGVAGALAAGGLLSQISPAPGASTLWVWVGAPLLILAMVVLAGLRPARRALVANPLATLRRD